MKSSANLADKDLARYVKGLCLFEHDKSSLTITPPKGSPKADELTPKTRDTGALF